MDIADRADLVIEEWLAGLQDRIRRDAAGLRHGALAGPAACSGCGNGIPAARRKAVPRAERCVHCQEMHEMCLKAESRW